MDTLERVSPGSLAVLVIVLYFSYRLSLAAYRLWFHPLANIPGPRLYCASRLPWIIQFVKGDLPRTLERLHAEYGPIVRTAPNEVSFTLAEAQKDIHSSANTKFFQKDPKLYPQRHPTARSIFTADHPNHARHRKVFNPAFSDRALREQEPLFNTYIDQMMDILDRNKVTPQNPSAELDLVKLMNWTTFDMVGHLALGEPFGCLKEGAYHPWVSTIFDNIRAGSYLQAAGYYPLVSRLLKLCIPRHLVQRRENHSAFTREKVEKRLATDSNMPDFMSFVLANSEGNLALSPLEIELDAAIILMAGSETTATTLDGVFYYLCKTPDAMRLVTEEVRSSFADEQDITPVRVGKLKYLTACIQEGLRLYPGVPSGLARQVTDPNGRMVGGKWMPPKTIVAVPQYVASRSPLNFHLPDEFHPERWLGAPEFSDDALDVVQAFGMGPRNCIGQAMGWLEMRLIISRILFKYDMSLREPVSGFAPEKQNVHFLWAKKPLIVAVKSRLDAE